jgi:hypothetical protein
MLLITFSCVALLVYHTKLNLQVSLQRRPRSVHGFRVLGEKLRDFFLLVACQEWEVGDDVIILHLVLRRHSEG